MLYTKLTKDLYYNRKINEKIQIEASEASLVLHFPDSPTAFDNARVMIEEYEGQLRVVVWNKTNEEDPVIIKLERLYVKIMADLSAALLDYVYCNNCDTKMLVDIGENTCPNCLSKGNMADIRQEINNPLFGRTAWYGRYIDSSQILQEKSEN